MYSVKQDNVECSIACFLAYPDVKVLSFRFVKISPLAWILFIVFNSMIY